MTKTESALLASALLLMGGSVSAENGDKPQYGGSLEIGTVYVTLSALSWDPADFNWKLNHDTGLFYEQLFAGDLSKSKKAGGPFNFIPDAWLATDASAASWSRSWEWKQNPLRVEMKVRKGVMFPEKPGVMKKRELVAEDIVFTTTGWRRAPRSFWPYFDHVDKVEATDSHTVVFYMKHYFAEWDYRFGWGYYSAIHPKEVADAGASNWKNVNGTGPYMLTDFVPATPTPTPRTRLLGQGEDRRQEYKLPFVDKIIYRTIKDEATFVTALRTGKLDMLEAIRWQNVDR
jgi:peptide/nickel transport system substrate-binding protein